MDTILTKERRNALGSLITNWLSEQDEDGRMLDTFDYFDVDKIDALIDEAIAPAIADAVVCATAALSAPAEATQAAAWMTEDGERVIPDATKRNMPRAVQAPYTVALGRIERDAAAPQPPADAARAEPVLWVRVVDRLPPKNETVIVACEFDGPGDWRKKAGGLLDDGTWRVFGASWTPTHWTPMPASPAAAPAQQPVALTNAARDVLAERCRQIEQEGWTPAHDDDHQRGELAMAAAAYAHAAGEAGYGVFSIPREWPVTWVTDWWKPTTPRRDLIKAGALILAEIERLDRAALQSHPEGGQP